MDNSVLALLDEVHRRAILKALLYRQTPTTLRVVLGERFGTKLRFQESATAFHLKKLVAAGLVEALPVGESVYQPYIATAMGRQALAEVGEIEVRVS